MSYDPLRGMPPSFGEWKAAQSAPAKRWPKQSTECVHGAMVRKITRTGHEWSGYYACPLDKSGCQIVNVGPSRVFQEWAEGGPDKD